MTKKEVIELAKGLDGHDCFAVAIWSERDVLSRAQEIGRPVSMQLARTIIDEINHKQDASIGINWDVLDANIP